MTTDKVAHLIEAATTLRDKAVVAVLANSGLRLSEVERLRTCDLDVARRQARVWTKGGKEGWLVFGATTAQLLTQYLAQQVPHGRETLFGLTAEGVDSVLDRLAKETGIKCNAHSFRRGFATELRKAGGGELDIMQLGR
jgi:integrase/recombinase XerC